jgi:glycosyltransferase involved in cell wall biosynthesis
VKRVGLDARLTDQLSDGMKTYVRELAMRLPAVAPEFEFVRFANGRNFGWDEQIALPLAMRRAKLNLMHFLSIYVPLAVPVRSVVTVHDLIHLRFPQYFKSKVGPYYQIVVRLACARAKRVITDDERTVDDLERFLGVDPAKVRVVPLGVGERFMQPVVPHAGPRPYFLYVGNHRQHKDLGTLFSAWSSLPQELEIDLYLTGPDDFGGELRRRSSATRQALALGDVPLQALAQYYAGARALVQPALREGFGLPILEAMAAGCVVVASTEAIPRVLESAALTFDAGNASQLSATLQSVVTQDGLPERFIAAGRAVAATLGWDRCARATADVYREVLEAR